MPEAPRNERARWLDDFDNVRKVYRGLWITCATLLFGGDALLRWARARDAGVADTSHHPGFAFEAWPGFYALFGFVACVALVLAAKELRKVLMRPEDYYEPGAAASEPGAAAYEPGAAASEPGAAAEDDDGH